MRSQKVLRDELQFMSEFNLLCDVMQQAAVSQLRRLDEHDARQTRVAQVLSREFFPLLPGAAGQHPFVRGGTGGRLVIAMTSSEGLVGPLHANVIRHALEHADATTQWIFIGHRGLRFLGARADRPRLMPMPSEAEAPRQLRRLAQVVRTQFLHEALRDVWLVAPHFLSTTRQAVVAHQLLPLPVGRLASGEAGSERLPRASRELLLEPSVSHVVEELALLWVEAVCVESFWSARRAELAARTLQMESSREEAAKRSKRLHHEFFKTLHGRVDAMVRETCVVQRLSAVANRRQAGLSASRMSQRQDAGSRG